MSSSVPKEFNFWEVANLSPAQIAGFKSVTDHPYTLWGGSMGSGKTYWLVATATLLNIMYASYDHKVVGALATIDGTRVQDRFMEATQQLIIDTGMGQVKDGKNGYGIYFNDPKLGMIRFVSLHEWQRIKGLQSPYLGIDELTEIPEEAFQLLMTRVRYLKGNRPIDHWPIFGASNPDGPHADWVYKYFVEKTFDTPMGENLVEKAHEFHFIPATVQDNPNEEARERYMQTLEGLTESKKNAYLYGIWDSSQGARFPYKLNDLAAQPNIQDHWIKVLGVDWGRRDDASAIWIAFDEKGNGYIYRHHQVNNTNIVDFARQVAERTEERLDSAFCDPTMAAKDPNGKSLISYFEDAGIFLQGSTNKHEVTNAVIEKYLQPGNGYPDLYFYRTPKVLGDLGAVRFNPKKGQEENLVPHANTHSVYSLGYALHGWWEQNPLAPDEDPETTHRNRIAQKQFEQRMRQQG